MEDRNYKAKENRYSQMEYHKCGKSGLKLPPLSLGLWQNFGHVDPFKRSRKIILRAFDRGITHFDLANNYGPPPGSAEENFGRVLQSDLKPYRDQLIISSKAGYLMWPGPYGDWGSRKYVLASLDQSLKRMGLEYVDIFYHHREDPDTPLEETMSALDQAVKQGKALYVGISNYSAQRTKEAAAILEEFGTPFILHQPHYNMFDRTPENELFGVLEELGLGAITYSPLAQGLLTDKYLDGIPEKSRMASEHGELKREQLSDYRLQQIKQLNAFAEQRGMSLAQLALLWNLRHKAVTSVVIGVSSEQQLENNLETLENEPLTYNELQKIDHILG